MTWIGNPAMWWKTRKGMRAHILSYGMKFGEQDPMMAYEEAFHYAKCNNIKCYVLCAFGASIAVHEDISS
jgi:hypothetical protein